MDRSTEASRPSDRAHASPSATAIFAGSGEMRALCRDLDWAATPLGPVEQWPQSLRTSAATVLATGFPGIVLWGPQLVQIYNDGYVPFLGVKHPWGLGKPTRECWPEVWHFNAPIYERVGRGETVTLEEQLYPLRRRGPDAPPDDVYITISYSPVPDESGGVGGVFITLFDVTSQVAARAMRDERDRANRRAAQILDQISDAHITMDADFRILSVNPAAERALGKPRDELLGRTHWEAFPASVGSEAERQYRRVATEGVETHFAHHYVGEGYDVRLEIDAYPTDDQGVAVFWRDVTARFHAEQAQRDLTDALELRNAELADQAVELEFATQQLEDNAVELEMHSTELQATAAALEERTHEAERAAAELRASETRLRDVFEQAPVAVAVLTGPDHVYAVASPRYTQFLGGRPLIGLPVREAVPEAVVGGLVELMDRVYRTGEPYYAAERRLLLDQDNDGVTEEYFFDLGYQPLRDADGRVYAVASTGYDVTAQVVARRELEAARADAEAARERLFAVLAQLPVGVVIVEAPSGRAVVINDALARIWGQSRQTDTVERYSIEWIGYHPDGRRVASDEWPVARALLHGEAVTGMLIEIERPGGERRWVELSAAPVRDASGRIAVAVAVASDVTDRRQADRERERLVRELEFERARLADVFRQAPAFLAVLRGPEHVFELVNDAYYQLVGHRDLIGKPLREAIPEIQGQGFLELLDGVLATGTPWVGHEVSAMIQRTPGGPLIEIVMDLVYMPLVEADQRRTGIIAHGTDITEQVLARREVERLLGESERARSEAEQARAEADAANRAKSEFLATMSHEIRTPINAIQGYAQLLDLGLGGAVTPQQRDYLGRLATSSQHLLGLINDVLDLSKVEAGELAVSRESAVTGRAIVATLDLVAPQAAARGVRIVDADRGAPGVAYVGDEHRVRQVLVNLLSNAVKFTEPGGTVTITSGSANEAPSHAHSDAAGPWAFVRVEDTGVGIAPELQTAVFEPFMQVESGHTRTKGGTGLGLAISRRLARLMGGDLTLESVPGQGSTFTLWLPGAARPHTGWTAEMTAAQVAGARTSELAARSLGELGELLRTELDTILASYVDRLRRDPATPLARGMERGALEDHAVTLLADLAQSLVIAGEAGADAVGILRDGSGIQRVIAEHHGVRRHTQGWTLSAVRRDYQLLLEELERVVRSRRVAGRADGEGDAGALRMLVGLVERSAQASARSWRRAEDADGAGRGRVAPTDVGRGGDGGSGGGS
ncbi:MAG TPA: PAS domain-containing protein [Gemmatimonadaceae bacterium]|nr:PAS domain-containing protein [Gemmatimonadaceae bacterium]